MRFNELSVYEKEELLKALNNYTCTLLFNQDSIEHKLTIKKLITELEDDLYYS